MIVNKNIESEDKPMHEATDSRATADLLQLAKRLKEAREYLGLNQDFVAEKLGIPRPAISSIENGKRRVKSHELKMLASLYKRKIDYFLSSEDQRDSEDDLALALYRATHPLSSADREQVLQFASFLKNAGKPPLPVEDDEEVL